MCGITGYVGGRASSVRLVLDNLKRLEYRGYDSAGVAVVTPNSPTVTVMKKAGKLANLTGSLGDLAFASGAAIAHTRWATHGRPNDGNAHPHTDCSGRIALIHNGIIENYLDLKDDLLAQGHTFSSDTDTEVLVHLIEERLKTSDGLETALRSALASVTGAYSICVVSEMEPDVIYAAKTASPLIIGLGEGENFLASDIPAVMEYTRRVLVLEDGDFVKITPDQVTITTLEGAPLQRDVFAVTWDVSTASKGGYDHFMLKEIHEQPQTIRDTLRGRVSDTNQVMFPELKLSREQLLNFNRIVIVACGTAYHAGMVAKHFYEALLRRPVEVSVASEFRYSDPIVDQHTLAIIISQSGETADTLAALREAKVKGATTLAVVNVVGSSIAREADEVIYTYAGPEISVASTKAYTTQLVALYLVGLFIAEQENRLGPTVVSDYVELLKALPAQVAEVLKLGPEIKELAQGLSKSSSFFFLGRGFDYAVAMEAALKLKEVSYIHAEAYAAGEMKHGPLALVEPGVTVVCFATQSALYDKMLSNVKEITARDGGAVALVKEGDEGLDTRSVDSVLRIPSTHDWFMPILAIVPMQMLAYYIAAALGREIDQPRNLAKSVTVE
ncbi:MAG: glutamine--fructose-6-phosphate transaminase (isomerizing) [Capsulimonas sp.]|jgi:glucosamine--fructose-6-phosphate aminotransferase (isomerizing)|uniref:glutamine--fructose-6-phosphate transaminase (isomerizing) n=1 Tax=Capsulimonas sp. TaxID=2494211 RepID=UPI003263390F